MYISPKELKSLSKNYKLLYVEDDEISRSISLELFENFFSDIDIAVDGQEAIDKFKSSKYDLVITDILMPRMNGIELLGEIRRLDDYIPVLMLSAYNDAEYFLDAIRLGVDGYLVKPLDTKQFISQISKVINELLVKKQADEYQKTLEIEVKKRTLELDKKLHFDNVTGLLNRYSFFEDIKTIKVPTVIVIDIDKFKNINEFYGDDVGTKVLLEFGLFLQLSIKDTSFEVYRLSADEFALIDKTTKELEFYEKFVLGILEDIADFKVEVYNDYISIDITVGISNAKEDTFQTAEVALDYAKYHNKPYMIYTKDIDNKKDIQTKLQWKQTIRQALNFDMVVPVYQPIVDADGKVLKFESLMRIKQDDKLISPFFFLDIAITTKLYDKLSRVIIFEALASIKEYNIPISINFTYDDITNDELLKDIEEYMIQNQNVASLAVFEITEEQSMQNYDDVKDFIKRFRSYGVKFAIDDFGSGFSNFEYILEIEPEYLKIDGSLVKKIAEDEKSYILVKAIVSFSHELGIKVIAEYVCNEEIFHLLKVINVDEYQGFYFFEPLLSITDAI